MVKFIIEILEKKVGYPFRGDLIKFIPKADYIFLHHLINIKVIKIIKNEIK